MSGPRAEHIGSLKRPDILLQNRSDYELGKCTVEELRACEDACIAEIVRLQLDLGFEVITDGEFRRDIFYTGFYDKLSGLKDVPDAPEYMFQERLRRFSSVYGDEFEFMKKVAGSQNVSKIKLTIGAPEWYHFRHGKYTYEPTAYTNDVDYFADVSRIYREEIRDLYARGCRKLQIDDPILSCFCDTEWRGRMEKAGVDPEELFQLYLDVYNDCLRDKPRDMTIGLHICRGNVKPDGSPFTRGPYDNIARKLLTTLNFDCFYLDYDTKEAGSFAPLRYLPPNKRVILGLVSTKTPVLEDPDVLRGRILQAAEVIAHGEIPRTKEEALNQLSISPQCGFASHSRGFAFVTHEDMVQKLKLVRDVAHMVWGET
ncbi:UROD/MetE-like protein [Polyporus arcularius HHB13444]|uniref:UROD/MetE-like protein n=1 Tax=Polyporus arcularius HHB13444 TaxID=1314778 RepID=A0A5C3NUU0_9APHY|nr:UROD/MetE-like protein [Polyporus arcularius HHB13444]